MLFIACALMSVTIPAEKIKIYMVGDSTMANKKPDRYPETGWGQVLPQFFSSDVVIINKAMNGRSTKTFINENRWKQVLDVLQKGDYVFIQFGHNDEKVSSEKGVPLPEYGEYLIRYVTEARAKGAVPVLFTPIARRVFKGGKFNDTHGGYPDAMRKVAADYQVPLVDLQQKSSLLLTSAGTKESLKYYLHGDSGVLANYPKGIKDNTHFSEEGAKKMASLAVEGLKEVNSPLVKFLKN